MLKKQGQPRWERLERLENIHHPIQVCLFKTPKRPDLTIHKKCGWGCLVGDLSQGWRMNHNGEKPGGPWFKGKGQYHSFTTPQGGSAFKIMENNHIKFSKIGPVKTGYHPELQEKPKTGVVSKTQTGKRFVSIFCTDLHENPLPANKLEVGLGIGLRTFATFLDGSVIKSPRFFESGEKALAKAQRKKDPLLATA